MCGGLHVQPAPAGMFVYIFVLISMRECFLANFIMRLRNIASINMKGVFSLSPLFLNIFFNQGRLMISSAKYQIERVSNHMKKKK
jgi:hypothetical protein